MCWWRPVLVKETRPVLSAVIGREGKRWKIRIAVRARETDISAWRGKMSAAPIPPMYSGHFSSCVYGCVSVSLSIQGFMCWQYWLRVAFCTLLIGLGESNLPIISQRSRCKSGTIYRASDASQVIPWLFSLPACLAGASTEFPRTIKKKRSHPFDGKSKKI